jgi:hypothetical protein
VAVRRFLLGLVLFAAAPPPVFPGPLYGLSGPPSGLSRLDSRTLRPIGPRALLAGHSFGWSFSPDRSQIVLGSDGLGEVRFVDLRRMRVLGDVEIVPVRPFTVIASAWAGPRRVLAVLVTPGCCGLGDTVVAGLDAHRRRVVWRRTLHGSLQAGGRFRHSLVLVLGPPGRAVGPSRLAVVGPDGDVRSAGLSLIRSGSEAVGPARPDGFLIRSWNPGLAVDPQGRRAFVVQGGAPVAEVDLATLGVRYHVLPGTVSFRVPSAATKAEEGPEREAVWLGHGLLAVTGSDTQTGKDGRGRMQQWSTPAGLKLIDTRRWTVRVLDRHTTSVSFAAARILATSSVWDSRSQQTSGSGLTAYGLDGRVRFHLLGARPLSGVGVLGRYALAGGPVVDLRSGRVVATLRPKAYLLVGDEPFWY